MLLTGGGIPILAALNGVLGTRLCSPMAASVILFGLALFIALAGAAVTGSLGAIRLTAAIPAPFYFGGTFVAFYVIAVTFIAPRFGVGNAIFFVLVGQIASAAAIDHFRSEEHTSELQSLMRISYAVFCLQKKKPQQYTQQTIQ